MSLYRDILLSGTACPPNQIDMSDEPGVNPKDLIGRTKPGMGHVPPGPLYEVALAFDDGAAKYGAFNWRAKPVLASVYHDACKRHLDSWFHGENAASDSGIHHLAHAIACLTIILDAEQQGSLKDDRPMHNVTMDDILAGIAARVAEKQGITGSE